MKLSGIKDFFKKALAEVGSYFDLRADLVPQETAEAEIRSGVSFKGSQLVVLILAIIVASLGLNTDSSPVLIGAMLISPLMGPIIGMGLAIGIEDYALLRRGLKNIVMAVIGSIAASAIYFLISPQILSSSQLLARTSPTIYDVLIGFFGGAAGIVSIACKNRGQVMPGVAIATSLMPPLCTVGYGIATWQMKFVLGALYLFFTNMIFILFATWTVVKLLGYKKVVYQDTNRYRKVQGIVYTIVFATVGLSAWLTWQMIRTNIFLNEATNFVEKEMVFPNTQVLNHSEYISKGQRYIDVTLIGAPLPTDSLRLAMLTKLDSVGLGGTHLHIKQGFSIGASEDTKDDDLEKFYSLMQAQLTQKQAKIDSLREVLSEGQVFSDESPKLSAEVRVLFPGVRDLALAHMTASSISTVAGRDTCLTDTINIAFINAPKGMTEAERQKLSDYLSVRLARKDVHISLNPSKFPWPTLKQK